MGILFYGETHDLRALMELGGWKSERMVIRYTHVNPDHLADQINAPSLAEFRHTNKQVQK